MISQEYVSRNEILKVLTLYVQSKPEDLRWNDFLIGGAGQTIMELVAGLGSFIQTSNLLSKRENFLQHAIQRSSLLANSEDKAYSAYRGSCVLVRLTYVPDYTATVEKFDVLGSYGEYSVLASEGYAFKANQAIDIDVYIGKVKTDTLTAKSDKPQVFRYTLAPVSEDVELYLNDVKTPISSKVSDILNGKWWVVSNAYGSVDVSYINQEETPNLNYVTGTNIKIRYLELSQEISFDFTKLRVFNGVVQASSVLRPWSPPESKKSIPITAPMHNETQNVVRGRYDYKKLLRLNLNSCISANGRDVAPCIVEVTYLLESGRNLTAAEKQEWLDGLEAKLPYGVKPALVSDPVRINCALTLDLYFKNRNTSISAEELEAAKVSALFHFHRQLGVLVDLQQIEHELEQTLPIKVARATIQAGKPLQLQWNEYYYFTVTINPILPKA